ncbi:MAG TPA: hypothetical protein VNM87_02600 [Candidatus Udaeobacter sp.]|nr:hypothetical protein [Candidatus Udaeobacter sp.]
MPFPRPATFAFIVLTLVGLPALGSAAGQNDLWLHVTVDDQDGGGSQVRVNLPLALVEGVLPLLDGDHKGHFRVSDVDDVDLRRAWDAARKAPEGQFVEIPTHGEGTLHVAHLDGQLVFRALDDDSQVHVRVPWKVAEQLAAASHGGEADFDIHAMVRALRQFGPGELVRAEDQQSTIRLWIDAESGNAD